MEIEKTSTLLTALKLDEKPLTNQFMFVEELRNADGSFILSTIIKDQIKRNRNVILILCHNSIGHFQSISQKLDYNLMSLKESGEVYIIEILEKIAHENFLLSKEPLKKLYEYIRDQIEKWDSSKSFCIILENIGNLSVVNVKEVFAFINYMRTLMWDKKDSSVVCSMHNFSDCPNTSELCKAIKHFADVSVTIKDLQTGSSVDVTGHLTVRIREENFTRCTYEYQYQLQDRGFLVFAPGSRSFIS